MPDSTSTETAPPAEGTAPPATSTAPPAETPPEGTGTEAKTFDEAYVRSLRTESAKHRTDLRAKETEASELAARVQTFEAERPALESRATTAEAQAQKYRVALEKGLPLELAERLSGATPEELAADADVLAGLLGSKTPPADLGQGTRQPPPAPKAGVNDALRALALGK